METMLTVAPNLNAALQHAAGWRPLVISAARDR